MTTSLHSARADRAWIPWLIWGLGATSFLYAFLQRVAPSVMIDTLMRDLMVSGAVLGNLSAFYFYAYAGMQVPVGLMVDRYGPRRMVSLALLVAAAGSALFASAETIEMAYAGRLLVGLGVGFGYVSSLKLATNWFPARRFALLSGLTMTIGMMGGFLGQAPLAAAVESIGWRGTMVGGAVLAALLAALFWLVVRDKPADDGQTAPAEGFSPLAGLGLVLANPQNWLLALISSAMTAPMLAFAGLWGVAWMMQVHGLERAEAAGITSLTFVGWAVGSPVVGWLSDRFERPKRLMQICAVLALAALLAMALLPLAGPMMAPAFVILGLTLGGMVTGFALARIHNAVAVVGSALAFVNMAVTGTGAIFQPLIGWILDLHWRGDLLAGARVYPAEGYSVALLSLAGYLAVALAATLFIRENPARALRAGA